MRAVAVIVAVFALACAPAVPGLRTENATTIAPDLNRALADFLEELQKPETKIEAQKGEHYWPEIKLHGQVTDTSMAEVMTQMDQALKAKAEGVIININSPGGSVGAGMDLIEKMEAYEIPTVCVVSGEAVSMGFAILQACQTRVMYSRAILMAHSPSLGTIFSGNQDDWDSVASMMQALARALAHHCSHRLNVSFDTYWEKTLGGRQWWMAMDEALDVEAVDVVVPNIQAVEKILRSGGSL